MKINMTSKDGVTLLTQGKYCTENIEVTPTFETGGGGNYVLELAGESGTLTDEQYQAVVDNFPNVIAKINAGENHFIALRAVVEALGVYLFSAALSETGEEISCTTYIVNTDKSYVSMSYDFTSGLQVKQITFTDRPSLWTWLQSNWEKILTSTSKAGTQSIKLNTIDVTADSSGNLIEVEFSHTLLKHRSESLNYDIYSDSVRIYSTSVVFQADTYISVIDNSDITTSEGNIINIEDSNWSAFGLSVTITYIE